MEAWQALLLGVVEGLTEYLPVSSTGHLLLAERALGIPGSPASHAFAICIQAGAILAVLGLYRRRVASLLRGLLGRDAAGRKLLALLVAAFLPAAVFGGLFDDAIERHLFGLRPVVAAWFVGGVLILALRGRGRGPLTRALEELRLQHALVIGLAQCLAMWPGTSRSLVTIAGGLLCGLSLQAAVEFSFLLGVLTLGAATSYKALQHGGGMIEAFGASNLLLGFGAAFLSAAVAVKWMVGYLRSHGLALFGWYRIALAAAVAFCLWRGILSAN
jgi:undecaprenyl-diphosphatase